MTNPYTILLTIVLRKIISKKEVMLIPEIPGFKKMFRYFVTP